MFETARRARRAQTKTRAHNRAHAVLRTRIHVVDVSDRHTRANAIRAQASKEPPPEFNDQLKEDVMSWTVLKLAVSVALDLDMVCCSSVSSTWPNLIVGKKYVCRPR